MSLALKSLGNVLPTTPIKQHLNPGEFFFGNENYQISTLLGSCIAITLWHPILHIGGMCHFVLPERTTSGNNVMMGDGRYAYEAMALFEQEASLHKTSLREYQAKIFGGSNMLMNSTLREDERIGSKNAKAAVQLLYNREIPVLVAHVGESGHRRIIFNISTGDVWVNHEPLQKLIF